jgi:hypothetical protein
MLRIDSHHWKLPIYAFLFITVILGFLKKLMKVDEKKHQKYIELPGVLDKNYLDHNWFGIEIKSRFSETLHLKFKKNSVTVF